MKTKNQIYVALVGFLLAYSFLIAFLIYPVVVDIKNGFSQVLSYKEKVLLTAVQTEELDKFRKNYDERKSNLEKIDLIFVDSNNPVKFIEFLDKAASDSGAKVTFGINSNKSGNGEGGNLPVIVFNVSANGDFETVVRFIEKLETGPYMTTIDNITVKKYAEAGDKGKAVTNKVQADILIEVVTG